MEPWQADRAKREAASVVFAFFEAGKNKNFTELNRLHANASVFTKFDENAPHTRQNSQEAFIYEQAGFANLSDYTYQIDELRIDTVAQAAIATFYLTYKGMFVNNYSFEGKVVSSRSRVTMVLARFPEGWKIVHEHFSSFPDWSSEKSRNQE